MLLLFTVVSLGVWKYIQVPTNQNVNSLTNNNQQLLPTTNEPIQCSTNVETGITLMSPLVRSIKYFPIGLLFDLRNELQLNEERRLSLDTGVTYPLIFSVQSDQTVSIYFTLSQTCRLVLIGRREGIPKLSDHHFLDSIGKLTFIRVDT